MLRRSWSIPLPEPASLTNSPPASLREALRTGLKICERCGLAANPDLLPLDLRTTTAKELGEFGGVISPWFRIQLEVDFALLGQNIPLNVVQEIFPLFGRPHLFRAVRVEANSESGYKVEPEPEIRERLEWFDPPNAAGKLHQLKHLRVHQRPIEIQARDGMPKLLANE